MRKSFKRKMKRRMKESNIRDLIFDVIANVIIWPAIIIELAATCSGEYVVSVCTILIATFLLILLHKIKYANE